MRSLHLRLSNADAVEVFKALASDTRIALLKAIADEPQNISTLGQMLGITQSGATKHIQQLESAGLIEIEHRPGTQGTQKVCRLRYGALQIVMAASAAPDIAASRVNLAQDFIVEAANLEVAPPEMEGEIRSTEEASETNLIFVNNSATALRRYWLDTEGARQNYGIIAPGSTITQRTYSDHYWLVEVADGRALGIFRPNAYVGVIVVNDAEVPSPIPAAAQRQDLATIP